MNNRPVNYQASREELNRRLPYKSIVRWPELQTIETIPIEYHQNCISMDDYLQASFGRADNQEVRELFLDGLTDLNSFVKWLLQAHVLMSMGDSGENHYAGRSEIVLDHSNYAGQLRSEKLHVKFAPPGLSNIFSIARLYDDNFAGGHSDFKQWNDQRMREGMKMLFPLKGIEEPNLAHIKLEDETLSTIDVLKPGQMQFSHTDLSVPVMFCPPACQDVLYFYPGQEYIPQYLSVMQKHMFEAVSCMETQKYSAAVNALASYYQAGARSQAVNGIWNSVLMGHINAFLELLDYDRLNHMNLDFQAFCLEEEKFRALYCDLVFGKIRINSPV